MRYIMMVCVMLWAGIMHAESIDPTKPPNVTDVNGTAKKKNFDGFSIQSILISPERKTTIINGQSLAEGDSFQGYTVFEIQEYQVTLKRADETKVVGFENTLLKATDGGGAS